MNKPENHILVIFGASGDLTKRKIIPALFDLAIYDRMPEDFAIVGVGRTDLDDQSFRDKALTDLQKYSEGFDKNAEKSGEFIDKLYYVSIDTSNGEDYALLNQKLCKLDSHHKCMGNIIYYLATPPSLYEIIPYNLSVHQLNCEHAGQGWKRIIIEKPFGHDLSSARQLNKNLLQYFAENQIYRIDHYLGKETVQNVLVTRFSNGIFEPLWNRNYIHHIEITSAENIGVENRGGYYDQSGALRDMVQNHLLQLTCLIAMEPPSVIEPTAIRNETLKVFQSMRPLTPKDIKVNVIRGQYTASTIRGKKSIAYRDEPGVHKNTRTETFVAMKFFIDNWRWGGVPFYIRTGKFLPTRATEIVIHFKQTPHSLFAHAQETVNSHNQLVIRIQPDEGILLKFAMKVPGAGFNTQTVNMDFHYSDLHHSHLLSAYERLLLDCMQGDPTLYSRGDSVEAAWDFIQPIIDTWNKNTKIPLFGYPAGTWGPEQVESLFDEPGITWRYPCKNLANDGEYCEL